MIKVSKMKISDLREVPVRQLKEYTKAFGISTTTVFEKDDLAQLISSTIMSTEHMIIFKMNRKAAAALLPSNRNPSANKDTTENFNSHNNTNSMNDPFGGLFQNIGKGFQEVSSAFQGVGDAFKEAVSPRGKKTSENPSLSSRTTFQQPQASSSQNEYPQGFPSQSSSGVPATSQSYPPPPSSTHSSPSPNNSIDVDPPSITTMATMSLDLNTLSTKALKRILLRERVSTLDINDREELLRRVKVLVDNVSKELDTSNEDNLCKVCCER